MSDPAYQARLGKLDEVLTGLPHTYQEKNRLRNDIASLIQTLPSLTPSLGTFSGGGRSVTLFHLVGVIPITYGGSTYNIPVTIYFDPPYPKGSPRCFVTPAQGMALKPGHPNVDQGGMIYMPYLTSWSDRSSSLSELMVYVQSAFSASPPVYSTAAAPQPKAIAQRPLAQATATAAYPVAVAKAVPAAQAVAKAVAVPMAQPPQETQREKAEKALTEEARARWPKVLEPIISDMNAQAMRKYELQEKSDQVDAEIKRMEAATRENEAKEAELRGIEEQLQVFVEANAGKEPDPDSLKDELDTDSKLVLDLLSEEMALEEWRAALDELLESRKISMDDFLREVRDAAREQFKLKAMRLKAASTIQQASAIASGSAVPVAKAVAAPQRVAVAA